VLDETYTLKVIVIEPVHGCMRKSRVSRAAIDLSTVHIPQIRHNIDVVFRNVGRNISIDDVGIQNGEHVVSV
jgi:hypothetical protein